MHIHKILLTALCCILLSFFLSPLDFPSALFASTEIVTQIDEVIIDYGDSSGILESYNNTNWQHIASSKSKITSISNCTDSDNDGYYTGRGECGTKDCDDNDASINPGAQEICGDGIDNDCDKRRDNRDRQGCISCSPTGIPEDVCNGIDDDCDGLIDEVYVPTSTNCGVGECASTGQVTCVNGVEGNTCTPETSSAELCDGLDNNCDGSVDENLTRVTTCSLGKCDSNTGIETCTASIWGGDTCDPFAGATPECVDYIESTTYTAGATIANNDECIPTLGLNDLVETDCRFCHCHNQNPPPGIPVDPTYLPDRHHLLVGTIIPDPTSAPFGNSGELYECLSCHAVDTSTGEIVIIVERNCLACHIQNPSLLTAHHQTDLAPFTLPEGPDCQACHGDVVDDMDDGHFALLLNPDGTLHPDNNDLICGKCHNLNDFNDDIRTQCQRCHADPNDVSDPLNGIIKEQYPDPLPSGFGSAPNVKMHSSTVVGNRYGDWDLECVTCHNPHTSEMDVLFGIDFGMYTKDFICFDNPVTGLNIEETIELTSSTGPGSYADGPPHNENICEMCHTQTNWHRRDGSTPEHNDGADCTVCHPHIEGFRPACGECHDVPPQTGSHIIHNGLTPEVGKDTAAYGSTKITQDFSQDLTSGGTIYIMDCGNCHPLDNSNHFNEIPNSGGGDAQIELFNPNAPADSIKAKNPEATYTPGATIETDTFGLKYTVGGTCNNVYCHSGPQFETRNPDIPDTFGEIPLPVLNPGPDSDYPLWYDGQPWNEQNENKFVVRTRQYKSPAWGVDSFGCDGCHGYPILTQYPQQPGTAGVSAGAGDSHAWIDDFGYINLHVWNMGFDPLQCNTCHYATVRDIAGWIRNDNIFPNSIHFDDITIFDTVKHINGSKDVVFTDFPVLYLTSGGIIENSLENATFNTNTKTCSNVSCHHNQTDVKWGTPYRWWIEQECDICHRVKFR
jgi:hypothetical protein